MPTKFAGLLVAIFTLITQTTLQADQTAISNAACSNNPKVVANAISSIQNLTPELSTVINTLSTLEPSAICTSLNEMTGQQYGLSYIAEESNSRQFLRRLYDPIRSIVTTQMPKFSCEIACDHPFYPCLQAKPWLEVGGGQTFIHSNRNIKGVNVNNVEVSFGLQGTKGDFTFGIAGSYDHRHMNYRLNGTGKADTGFGALYGLYRPVVSPETFAWYVLGDLAYGYTNNIIKRHVDVSQERFFFKGDYSINQVFGYLETGFDLYHNIILIQPFIGFEAGTMKRSNIKEKGISSLNLSVNGKVLTNSYSRIGFHTTADSTYLSKFICSLPKISFSLDLAWAHRLTENSGFISNEKFQSLSDNFKIRGIKIDRNSLDCALTVSLDIYSHWQVFVEAIGTYSRQNGNYNFLGGVSYLW